MSAALRQLIIDWLDDNYHFGEAANLIKSDDQSWLAGGVLDSLGFVQLVLMLENKLKLKINRKELSPKNFDSMNKILTYVNAHPTAVENADESTSLQLAIWNSIYDTDATLSGGTFQDSTAYAAYADTLLAASASTVNNLAVYVLWNPDKQDFLVTRPVPEPETFALVLAGLGVMGAFTRRRTRQRA